MPARSASIAAEHLRLSVAPMMDWTDTHCRNFHRLLAPHARLYTEMVHANAVIHGTATDKGRDKLLGRDDSQHPVALQLGGSLLNLVLSLTGVNQAPLWLFGIQMIVMAGNAFVMANSAAGAISVRPDAVCTGDIVCPSGVHTHTCDRSDISRASYPIRISSDAATTARPSQSSRPTRIVSSTVGT